MIGHICSARLRARYALMRMRVAVAMSGGVDSSAAAALLKKQGYDVVGLTMRTWIQPSEQSDVPNLSCCTPGDEEDALRVARVLNISLHVIDVSQEFQSEVIDYFCSMYQQGRTPNPCVRCNQRIKFDALVHKAEAAGIQFDYFATGHYARVRHDETSQRHLLMRAVDRAKDQSYFLFSLSQAQLGTALFPLGTCTKHDARGIALELGLDLHSKPESQDFMGANYTPLLRSAARSGPILNKQGEVLGTHRGIAFYTIGQRKGLRMAAGERLYVMRINGRNNAVIVGTKQDVYRDSLIASEVNWIAIEKLREPMRVEAKIRYHHEAAPADISLLDGNRVYVKFVRPQMAIAPGQAVVFHRDETVVGGGIIESSAPDTV